MLSKASEYAIRALIYIVLQNQKGRRPGFREISKEIDSPVQFTAKILQNLSRNNILTSFKGRGGGFVFNTTDPEISLFDVIRVMEGDDLFTRCGFGLKSCNAQNPCPLHDDFQPIRDSLNLLARKETIHSLASKIRDNKAVLSRIYEKG